MGSNPRELLQASSLRHNSVNDFTAYGYLKVRVSSTISMISNYNTKQISFYAKYFNTLLSILK